LYPLCTHTKPVTKHAPPPAKDKSGAAANPHLISYSISLISYLFTVIRKKSPRKREAYGERRKAGKKCGKITHMGGGGGI
jgi:hypothetical protein